jgi:Icc-related predicted phosphoesterase
MFRLVWATDVHLEFADAAERNRFVADITGHKPDALMLTGDIANGKLIERILVELQNQIGVPIYFNLGNHDFYGNHIAVVRRWAEDMTKSEVPLFWIEGCGPVRLSDTVALVGVDGWGDGQLGDPRGSDVLLNDWDLIKEFAKEDALYNREARLKLLKRYGHRAGESIRATLRIALPLYKNIILMTHVPPWKEATWHEGAHSDAAWLPWFSCKAVGDAIIEETKKFPDRKVTVFCGHTHGFGYSRISEQVDVCTGGAKYRFPEVQACLEIENSGFTRVAASWYNAAHP